MGHIAFSFTGNNNLLNRKVYKEKIPRILLLLNDNIR